MTWPIASGGPSVAPSPPWLTTSARAQNHSSDRKRIPTYERRPRRVPATMTSFARAAADLAAQPRDWVVADVDRPLLQGDDRVVGDVDPLGAHLRAALRDVAQADAEGARDGVSAVQRVERVHLELRQAHEEAGADVALLVLLVVTDHVADVLAQEALDTLVELLEPVDVDLGHAPHAVGVPRAEARRRDAARLGEVERDVGHEVAQDREGAQRGDRDRLARGQAGHARHAHEARDAVDLRAARAALAGLAVPAHREVRRQLRLDAVDDVEHDLALLGRERVVAELPALLVAAPDAQRHLRRPAGARSGRHQCASSNSARSSAGISGSGSGETTTSPPTSRVTMFSFPNRSSSALG